MAAFIIDAIVVSLLSYLALWWDERHGWLYAYNGEQLGFSLTVIWFLLQEIVFRTTIGRSLCRLTIVTEDKRRPRRVQLALRALLFGLLVLAPAVFALPFLSLATVLDPRQRFIGTISLLYTIILLPLLSVAFSKEGIGVHDLATNTRVITNAEARDSVLIEHTRAPIAHVGWSPRMASVLGLTWVLATLVALVVDWSQGFSRKAVSTFTQLSDYVSSVLQSGDVAAPGIVQALVQGGEVRDWYFGPTEGVVLPGMTQVFTIPASADVVRDRRAALLHAQRFHRAIAHRLPSGLQWIDIRVANQRQFGFVSKTIEVRCLVNTRGKVILYAPRAVRSDSKPLGPLEWRDTIVGWVGDSIKPIEIVLNRPHVETTVGVTTGRWQPLSVDFLTRRLVLPAS